MKLIKVIHKIFFNFKKNSYFKKEDVVEFVEGIVSAHPKQRISLFWDNASVHVSKETIERMVAEAQEYEEEDRIAHEKIQAKNQLENFVYGVKQQINDEKLGVTDEDKATLETTVTETIAWLEEEHTTEEYKEKQQNVEQVVHPILMKYMNKGETMPNAGSGMSTGEGMAAGGGVPPAEAPSGPHIEEVD